MSKDTMSGVHLQKNRQISFEKTVGLAPKEYAPTPLNPYELDFNGVKYITLASDAINAIFWQNLARLPRRPAQSVIDLLEVSVTSALYRRFENNSGKAIAPDCDDMAAELFQKSCLGLATPNELISLLAHQPADVQSIELAKQTHPFDWEATSEMDATIMSMLDSNGFEASYQTGQTNLRHYFTRVDDIDKPATIIMIRKEDVGLKQTGYGRIIVTCRDSLALDLAQCETKEVKKEFQSWLKSDEAKENIIGAKKTPYTGSIVTGFLESQLAKPCLERSPALYPGVRSYYAHYASESDDSDSMTDA